MKSAIDTDSDSLTAERLTSPYLRVGELALINRYCRKHHQKRGPALLVAALREMRREFDIPEEAVLPVEDPIPAGRAMATSRRDAKTSSRSKGRSKVGA